MVTVKSHPDEWKDVKRMKFLMTDFRSRDANPEGYDDKMSFWIKTLSKWSSSPQAAEFNLKSIRDSFEKDGHMPSTGLLQTVMSKMMSSNQVMKRDVYKESLLKSMTEGWVSWGVTLATKPISWGLTTLIGSTSSALTSSGTCNSNIDPDEILINVESIDSLANKLFIKYKDSSLLKYEQVLEDVIKSQGITRSLFELLLLKLQSEKKVVIQEDCNFKLIKFGSKAIITQSEIGLVRLESAKEVVESDIKMIETSLEQLKNEARNAIKEGCKTKAKSILKKKKRLEVQLSKREAQLDNIEFLLEQLVESESHPTILTAMKAAADILKGAEAKHDEILDTLNEVEDVVHVHQNMVSDLSRSILDQSTVANDVELEEELNELLRDDEDIERKKKNQTNEGEKSGFKSDVKGDMKTSKDLSSSSVRKESEELNKKYEEQDQELQDLMDRLERLRTGRTNFDPLPELHDDDHHGKEEENETGSRKDDEKKEKKTKLKGTS